MSELTSLLNEKKISSIPIQPTDFHLALSLTCGQAFRWTADQNNEWWNGVISPENAFVRIRQTQTALEWVSNSSAVDNNRIIDLFRLDAPIHTALQSWRLPDDPEICEAIDKFRGLRVMHQDPFECLISFLASPAAPISRIRKNLQALCNEQGELVWEDCDGNRYNAFPTCPALCSLSRADYDRYGFGFRGKSIALAASAVERNGGEDWVRNLKSLSYEDAKDALCSLPGVGPKIADCVCLFSLHFDHAAPIDVHMARIATRLFPGAAPKSLSGAGYEKTAELFRARYKEMAGWAQQYLYCQAITK